MSTEKPASWARTLADPAAFALEQDRLAGTWTFLGVARDVARDGDWFRTRLATRPVFVQRFGDELRGFENRCAHRSYTLRMADKGNGPIVCGFHGWRYDRDGSASEIPQCEALFGRPAEELGARLATIEVATCGSFIFGRFPGDGVGESLEDFLGDGFPILKAMSRMPPAGYAKETPVRANWRLCCHITLDDYHLVAVHPTSFGKHGHPRREGMGYFRFGRHSGFLSSSDPQAMQRLVDRCRDGSVRASHYFILLIFPNLIISNARSDGQFWHVQVQQYQPVAHDRSVLRSWAYPAPFAAEHPWHVRWTRPFTDPARTLLVHHFLEKVRDEDHAVCARIQGIARQIDDPPLLGALEERLAWFEESYAEAIR